MKKLSFQQKCLLVAALLVAGYLWYTRPLPLDRLAPDLDWAEVTHIGGFETVADVDAPSPIVLSATLPVDAAQARDLYQALQSARFRRDPLTSLKVWLGGHHIYYFGEAGGAPCIRLETARELMRLELYEDGNGLYTSASLRDLYLRATDKTLFQTALDFLRANPIALTPVDT